MEGTSKKLVIFFAAVLFIIIAIGLFWIFTYKGAVDANDSDLGLFWWIFSFAAGLTMIVLPCTLPLAFVIVPLSMGRGVVKGLGMALSFGLGIALTLSLYGVAAAVFGSAAKDALGSASAETIKNWVYFIAGTFALVFALSEIGLMKFRMPSYTGAMPAFIQKRQDYLKALLLGLFLGNIGVGCPHPATPLLLIHIAVNGNIVYGWLLFLVHAIGRVLPLLFLAVLGIMGVNGLSWLVSRKDKVERVTGWAMVFVAGFILTLGLFSHKWWVNSGIHTQLESITQEEFLLNIVKTNIGSSVVHSHGPEIGTGLFGLPLWLGNWFLVFLWVFPIWWWWMKEKKRVSGIPPPNQVSEKDAEHKLLMSREKFFTTLTILLALVFIYILPTKFLNEAAQHMRTGTTPPSTTIPMHMDGDTHDTAGTSGTMDDHMMMGATKLLEEGMVKEGLVVDLIKPKDPRTGTATTLQFFVNKKPAGTPVDDLEIEHEKYMHMIGVRDDLTQFFHLHPEKTKAGTWTVSHTFSEGGNYKTWTDVTRKGASYSFGHPIFSVTDKGKVPSVPKQPVEFLTSATVGNYQVALHQETKLIAGVPQTIHLTVKDAKGNDAELDPYLGAQMHLVIIKDDLSEYIHAHPAGHMHMGDTTQNSPVAGIINIASAHGDEEEPAASIEDPNMLAFEPTFSKDGIYKLFAQFRPKDAHLGTDDALLAEFYVKVAKAGSVAVPVASAKVDPQVKWWSLLFISLILMSLLSYGVYRYLQVK